MGEWNATCGLTRLPIARGDHIIAIAFEVDNARADKDVSKPLDGVRATSLPTLARYDGLGGLTSKDVEAAAPWMSDVAPFKVLTFKPYIWMAHRDAVVHLALGDKSYGGSWDELLDAANAFATRRFAQLDDLASNHDKLDGIDLPLRAVREAEEACNDEADPFIRALDSCGVGLRRISHSVMSYEWGVRAARGDDLAGLKSEMRSQLHGLVAFVQLARAMDTLRIRVVPTSGAGGNDDDLLAHIDFARATLNLAQDLLHSPGRGAWFEEDDEELEEGPAPRF